jgi:predicted Rossmann-fold nucleotide-binding protein
LTLAALNSKLERKTGEAIAYLHDQERQALQKFVGFVPWDHEPLLATLARQVGEDLGEPDAVIVSTGGRPGLYARSGVKKDARAAVETMDMRPKGEVKR